MRSNREVRQGHAGCILNNLIFIPTTSNFDFFYLSNFFWSFWALTRISNPPHLSTMCNTSHFGLLVAILGVYLGSAGSADSISNEDVKFLSHWTRLSVDSLKKYETVVGKLSFCFTFLGLLNLFSVEKD